MIEMFNRLTKEIKNHDQIVIISHNHMDYDGLGTAIGLCEIALSFKKETHIYLEDKYTNIFNSKLCLKLEQLNINFIYKENYKKIINNNTLLIVVDTHKKSILSNPNLVEEINDIIVIDHHIKNDDYIKNITASYIDSSMSSVCEFVAKYIRYLNKEIRKDVATIILAGIELDTNSFHTKTTDETFKVAAFLNEMGANSLEIMEIMQEDKEKSIKRMKYLTKAYTINDKIMICPLDDEIVNPKDLAIISEMQLKFDNIEYCFALGYIAKNVVGISARSIGKVSVEDIMQKFGGGGHLNEAAAQIKDKTIKEITKDLEKIIKEVK